MVGFIAEFPLWHDQN